MISDKEIRLRTRLIHMIGTTMDKVVTLSIIIISHNQKKLLKRCVDSILSQAFRYEYEIIISDDASTDGTWELIKQYAKEHKKIKVTQCNSSDFNPTNDGSRGSWNRCNAYSLATGKYIAFVDGDDFFISGSDIYQKQVELLEQHPECSCCMANDYVLNCGDDISQAKLKHNDILPSGQILSSEEYIRKHFRESHCFVYRRNPIVDPVKLYGGYFEDTVITDHHIQFGDILCLNEAGYVYVQHPSSVWAQQIKKGDYLIFAHSLYIPKLIPKWKHVFLLETRHLVSILQVVNLAISRHKISEDNLQWANHFNLYLYHAFNRKLNVADTIRLRLLNIYLRAAIKFNFMNRFSTTVLYSLL